MPAAVFKPPSPIHVHAGESRSSSSPKIGMSPHRQALRPISPIPLDAIAGNRWQTPPVPPESEAPLLLGSGLPAQLDWARPIVARREQYPFPFPLD
jgi:hypothetical protein